ncbi:MAG: Ig-like domain-containing protein, partial [Candidatus Poribacteria bacterium]|nr:Ig-like domain-containing protein [Candidatus Poribacteria bacterium]
MKWYIHLPIYVCLLLAGFSTAWAADPPANNAPVATAQSVTTDEDAAVAITLAGTDADDDALTYTVVDQPSNGALSGTAPNLTYTPNANYNGADSFTFRVNDGTVDSEPATVSITVTAVNDPPVATAQSVTTAEDTEIAITLAGTDADGDGLTFTVIGQPYNGALSGTAPNLTYTPNANFNGDDSFRFKVSDGPVDSDHGASVFITVTAVNDPPVATAQSVTTSEDTAVDITLAGTDGGGAEVTVGGGTGKIFLAESDHLTYTVVDQPSNGTLTGTAPYLTYTPNANYPNVMPWLLIAHNYNGDDSFTFKVNDGTVDSATATVSITVTAVDDAPVAYDQSVITNKDTAVSIVLEGRDVESDAISWPLFFTVVNQPSNGTLSGIAPNPSPNGDVTLTYTPNADYNGDDSFTFKVDDGPGWIVDSEPATVSITVTAVNNAPVATAQSATTAEDTAVAITLAGTDTEGDTLTYTVVDQPANGALSGTASNLTYTPNADYNGDDSFTFKVNDGTVDSATATISITVTAVNDPPVASAQSVTTAEDTAVAITLAGTDADGDTLTYTVVGQPTNGVLSGTTPNLTYTPNADFFGNDSFTFKVNDGTVDSGTATVSITVTAVNDPPVANDQSVTVVWDRAPFAITLTGTDADGDVLTYTMVECRGNVTDDNLFFEHHTSWQSSEPQRTLALFNAPDPSWMGFCTFKVNDGTVDSNTATVSITVINNAPPVASAQSVSTAPDTAIAIKLSGWDPNNDALIYTVVTQPTYGTLSATAPQLHHTSNANYTVFTPVGEGPSSGPQLIYTPNATYTGNDSFTFKVNDGTVWYLNAEDSNIATVTITVTVPNQAPVAKDQLHTAVNVTGEVYPDIFLSATDADNDTLTYTVVTNPSHGTLSGTAPALTYTPNAGYSGNDSFTFRVNDGTVDSEPATISIIVAAPIQSPNDAPVATAQSVSTVEDTAVAITLAGTDADGDTLTYTVVDQPSNGALSGTAPNLTYIPNADYNGNDSFTFKANDGTAD